MINSLPFGYIVSAGYVVSYGYVDTSIHNPPGGGGMGMGKGEGAKKTLWSNTDGATVSGGTIYIKHYILLLLSLTGGHKGGGVSRKTAFYNSTGTDP